MKKSKRMNDKRTCGFCKRTFPSQRTYNRHVNTCDEKPVKKWSPPKKWPPKKRAQ